MPADQTHDMPPVWKIAWGLVGVPVAAIFALGLVWHVLPKSHRFRDLTQDWYSIRCYQDGKSIYTPLADSLGKYIEGDLRPLAPIKVNAHPPVSVLALLPFGYLSHDQAMVAWNLLSLALVPLALWLVLGPFGLRAESTYLLAGLCLVISSAPLAANIIRAQYNVVLLVLIALAWVLDRHERQLAAGLALGLAASLKLFPGFLLVYFLAARRWQALASALVTIAAAHALAALVLGLADVLHYFRHVVHEVDQWRSAWLNASLAGYWSRFFWVTDNATRELAHWPALARGLSVACSAAVGLAVGWKSFRARGTSERDVAYSAAVVGMLLVSPVTWDHYLVLLTLPVAVLWFAYAGRIVPKILLTAVAGFLAFVPSHYVWFLFLRDASQPRGLAVAQPIDAATVLGLWTYGLAGLLVLALWRTDDETPEVEGQ